MLHLITAASNHLVATAEGTTPTPADGTPVWVSILVASIAAIPGIGGLIYTWRKRKVDRRDHQESTATEFTTRAMETAFKNMEKQLQLLIEDREQWESDKAALLDKIDRTNAYLQLLLVTLDVNKIPRPKPPTI